MLERLLARSAEYVGNHDIAPFRSSALESFMPTCNSHSVCVDQFRHGGTRQASDIMQWASIMDHYGWHQSWARRVGAAGHADRGQTRHVYLIDESRLAHCSSQPHRCLGSSRSISAADAPLEVPHRPESRRIKCIRRSAVMASKADDGTAGVAAMTGSIGNDARRSQTHSAIVPLRRPAQKVPSVKDVCRLSCPVR